MVQEWTRVGGDPPTYRFALHFIHASKMHNFEIEVPVLISQAYGIWTLCINSIRLTNQHCTFCITIKMRPKS